MTLRTKLAIGGAVAAALYTVYALGLEEVDENGDAPLRMTPQEVCAFFDKLVQGVQQEIVALMQQLQQYSGQIPQKQKQDIVLQQFDASVKKAQGQLLGEMDVELKELEACVGHYTKANGFEEVEAAVGKLRSLYLQCGGTVKGDIPEGLTEETLLRVLEQYLKANNDTNRVLQARLSDLVAAAGGGQPGAAAQAELKAMQTKLMAENVAPILKAAGLTEVTFQLAMAKFGEQPAFEAKVREVAQRVQAASKP